ncbi:hypothetical protein WJX77_006855 [Trebouxia sp. C0004]
MYLGGGHLATGGELLPGIQRPNSQGLISQQDLPPMRATHACLPDGGRHLLDEATVSLTVPRRCKEASQQRV